MGRTNLSTLELNIIHSFGAFDAAADVERMFLQSIDRFGSLEAERRANLWGEASNSIDPMIGAALVVARRQLGAGPGDHGVRDFIRTRFQHMGAA